MKIKHWSGYGSVNVVLEKKERIVCPFDDVKIKRVFVVSGMHELGLSRESWDTACIERWLKRWIHNEPVLCFTTQEAEGRCIYTVFTKEV